MIRTTIQPKLNTFKRLSFRRNQTKFYEESFVGQLKNSEKDGAIATPLAQYNYRVKTKQLNKDEHQLKVVKKLDNLFLKIIEHYQHKNIGSKANGLKKTKIEDKINFKSIYLYGTVGTGKTMLMDLLYSTLPDNMLKRRVHFHAFLIEIHARIHKFKKENPNVKDPIVPIVKQLSEEANILCFDELQVTDIVDAMLLRRLFFELFDRNVTLITTSNRHPDDLYKNGLHRQSFIPCIELLKKKCQIIDLNSQIDYRKLAKDSESLYFSPCDSASEKKFLFLFNELTAGHSIGLDSINFLGRKLLIPQASANGVAKFTFKQLCHQPMNAADYIQLTTQYPTLFLDEIPCLDKSDFNIIRRFITLIDALYESKATLIIRSDVSLNELFPNSQAQAQNSNTNSIDRLLLDDLKLKPKQKLAIFTNEEEIFALDRAYSRLIEMQSFNWIMQNPKSAFGLTKKEFL